MQTHHALALIPAAVAVLCVVVAVYIVYKEQEAGTLTLSRAPLQLQFKPPRLAARAAQAQARQLARAPHSAPLRPDMQYASAQPMQAAPEPVAQAAVQSRLSINEESDTGIVVVPQAPPIPTPDTRTPWQRFAEDDLHADKLVAPKPQPRVPLNMPKDVQQVVKLKRLTFQSEERDPQMYPTPSIYRLKMPVPMRNVVSVSLTNAAIPLSEYLMNEYTQWLDVEYLGTLYQVQAPLGDWNSSIGSFATMLQAAMIAAGLPAALTVTSSIDTQRLTFSTNTGNPWRFLMRSGPNVNRSMWQVIGFPRVDTALATTLVGEYNVDFQGTYAVDVFIDEISCHLDSADNMVAHVILQKFLAISVTTYKAPPDAGLPRTFFPIARLQYLTFRFLVSYTILNPDSDVPEQVYRPYLPNGRNHTIQLDFGCKEYVDVFEQIVELDPQS